MDNFNWNPASKGSEHINILVQLHISLSHTKTSSQMTRPYHYF